MAFDIRSSLAGLNPKQMGETVHAAVTRGHITAPEADTLASQMGFGPELSAARKAATLSGPAYGQGTSHSVADGFRPARPDDPRFGGLMPGATVDETPAVVPYSIDGPIGHGFDEMTLYARTRSSQGLPKTADFIDAADTHLRTVRDMTYDTLRLVKAGDVLVSDAQELLSNLHRSGIWSEIREADIPDGERERLLARAAVTMEFSVAVREAIGFHNDPRFDRLEDQPRFNRPYSLTADAREQVLADHGIYPLNF